MMNLRSYSPPPKKPTPRDLLDELVRSGYRPYICGDVGVGIVIAWAKSVYVETDLAGEPGFRTARGMTTMGLVPDVDASIQRVSDALGCDRIKRSAIDASLERLISSSIKLLVDDFGNLLLKPVV